MSLLSKTQLKNLSQHKYESSGSTLLEPILQKYWCWLITKTPLNLSPNIISATGLFTSACVNIFLMINSPNSTDYLPTWVVWMTAISLFMYSSLDALDGKQARRTNTNNPLGELVDHTADAFNSVFAYINISIILRLGTNPWLMFIVVFGALSEYYVANWQTYVSGLFNYGRIDCHECDIGICLTIILTALFGQTFWENHIPYLEIEYRCIPIALYALFSLNSILSNIGLISKGGKGKNGLSIANTSVFYPALPLIAYLTLTILIVLNSRSKLFESNTCLFALTMGFVCVKMTFVLVLARLTKDDISLFEKHFIGPLVLVLVQFFSIFSEKTILTCILIYQTYDLFVYLKSITDQICEYMDIRVFIMKPIGISNGKNGHLNKNGHLHDH